MDHQDFALTVITLSALAGLYLGTGVVPGEFLFPDDNRTANASTERYVYGSAHEHALFYVSINGTEKDFSAQEFQLNANIVHLENNNSRIVHKHAEGVTWKMFLDTINVSVEQRGEEVCINIQRNTSCGNGTIMLNGEKDPDLETEIQQGDNLAIVIGKSNIAEARNYMKKQLPRDYIPQKLRGRRI